MKLRTIGMTGVMSLAGLGLVGAGAHAVFTQNTTSRQTITAGTMHVTLHSDSANTVVSLADNSDYPLSEALRSPPVNSADGSSFMEAYHGRHDQ